MNRLPIEKIKETSPLRREMSEADYEHLRKNIGDRLKIAFDTESYSEIGRQLDIPSVDNVKQYVTGKRFPSGEVLARFRAKGYSLEWLFTGQGSKWAVKQELFTDADEHRIQMLARQNGIGFWDQVILLTHAALNFADELENFEGF